MKKIFILYAVVALIFIYLLITYVINLNFIFNYNQEKYEPEGIIKLVKLRPFSYITNYNLGNMYYKNENYDEAIKAYELSLKLFPPEKKECSIRINLALAMLNNIDLDVKSEEEIEDIIAQLEKIIDVLVENGCAHRSDNYGHSKEAQRLKNEIDSIIKALRNRNGSSSDDPDEEEEETPKPKNDLSDKEEQLRGIQTDSTSQRSEKLDSVSVDFVPYTGKKW